MRGIASALPKLSMNERGTMKTEINKREIAVRVREAREWMGISQVKVAELMGVSRQTYLDIETGKTDPKLSLIAKFAEITEQPLNWLVYGADHMQELKGRHKNELDELLNHLERLPLCGRGIIIKQAVEMAKFQAEYTKTLKERWQR